MNDRAKKSLKWLLSPKLTVYCLAFLMVLVFSGTLYQTHNGLYAAQQRFFNSWLILLGGFIPFPGTQLVLAVLLVNLTGYFIYMLLTQPLKPGIVLVHAGVLMLLLGGAITHHFAEESHLTLSEGEGSSVSASYQDWEIAVWTQDGDTRDVLATDSDGFKPDDVVKFDAIGMTIKVEQYYRNARAFKSTDPNAHSDFVSDLGISSLEPAKFALEPAENVAAGIFTVSVPGLAPVRLLLFGEDMSPTPLRIGNADYYVALRHKRFPMPMLITLLEFKRELHPGTDIAKSYSSKVEMQADKLTREITISMNKPLRHHEYTLYQASFAIGADKSQSSTFAVAKNYGRLIPYTATTVVVLGMVIHFLIMLVRKASRASIVLVLVLLGLAPRADAAMSSVESFGRIPVQDGGRIMPMDSYARLKLLQISGHSTFGDESAAQWLARLVFTPQSVDTDQVFLVNNPEVLEAIDVKAGNERRFSFTQIEPGVQKLHDMAQKASDVEEKSRSAVEKEIVRVYQNVNAYLALSQCFSFARPNSDFAVDDPAIREKLDLPADAKEFSFYDIFLQAPKIASEIETVSKTDQSKWTSAQRQLFTLSSMLYQWSQIYSGLPIAMLPIRGHAQEQWISPWDALAIGFVSDEVKKEMGCLNDMARAYVAGRQVEFDIAAHSVERSIKDRAGDDRGLTYADLELLYNKVDPFYRAEILYGFAFLCCLAFILVERRFVRSVALVLVALAFVPHTFGLVSRMVIMGRPPVTNLFATFVFVSWICVVLGFVLEWFQRNALGLLLSSVAGLVLLMVAGRFSLQGDTLSVVVAVLDSNFWLSTHVVSITIGYAGCVAAGVAGHIYLLKALRYNPDSPQLKSAAGAVYGLLAFGLTFSFLGTMLGGVWADQSWGRFWGWDPKENGALLIVLWCSLLFHARVAKMIGPLGMAAGSVLGVIVVLMAWIGINLLGVGLHSYGFTTGLAQGLWISVTVELLFVALTVPFAKKASGFNLQGGTDSRGA